MYCNSGKFDAITKYIEIFSNMETFGEWIIDRENDGSPEHPIHMPYVEYSEVVMDFIQDYSIFVTEHQEYNQRDYLEIKRTNNLTKKDYEANNYSKLDSVNTLALITNFVQGDRFGEGFLEAGLESGAIVALLKRLREIDDERKNKI